MKHSITFFISINSNNEDLKEKTRYTGLIKRQRLNLENFGEREAGTYLIKFNISTYQALKHVENVDRMSELRDKMQYSTNMSLFKVMLLMSQCSLPLKSFDFCSQNRQIKFESSNDSQPIRWVLIKIRFNSDKHYRTKYILRNFLLNYCTI